eukprot:m.394814 g.394814  ORF g.394814 m.394814 type:complete len:527 (-) comp21094_c1_seq1:308-1888(-)
MGKMSSRSQTRKKVGHVKDKIRKALHSKKRKKSTQREEEEEKEEEEDPEAHHDEKVTVGSSSDDGSGKPDDELHDQADKAGDFKSLGLSEWLVRQASAVGITKPTLVQQNCIPAALEGKDVCGVAKTGSGKTAAFAMPILQRLGQDPHGLFAIVLTPTRELAIQIAEQFSALGAPIGLRHAVVIGGMDMMKQAVELSHKPHVIVATPGRLADHITAAGTMTLKRVKTIVFDEADRLLENTSFAADIETIIAALPSQRQVMLFTATALSVDVDATDEDLSNTVHERLRLRSPVFTYTVASPEATVARLEQSYVLMPAHVRHAFLVNVLRSVGFTSEDEDASAPRSIASPSCIVFTSTCRSCAEIALLLKELNVSSTALHSQLSQAERLASLGKFRSGHSAVLVATDVASRGLDIAPVATVINFNVPKAPTDYIHRVGRTARAGRGGRAITLMSEHDVALLHAIEARVGVHMAAYDKLEESDVLKSLTKVNVARRAGAWAADALYSCLMMSKIARRLLWILTLEAREV